MIEVKTVAYGWFDAADQETPTFDPGLTVPCPLCGVALSERERITESFLVLARRERSYFFRAHRACWNAATDEQRWAVESAAVDEIASGVQ